MEMIEKIEKCIQEYAIKYSKNETVGGPIMILQIKPDNTFVWLKNKPNKKPYLDGKDLFSAYKNGDLNIHFNSSDAKHNFEAFYGQL